MSYEPLHHKYRPRTFAELVGQEAIATTLTNAINTLKIAPAYLFTGPRGTGKTSSARILAKSLNCLNGDRPTPQPCGKCDACQGISKGATLDVIEIDAASNTGVDNIREIIERAQFAPVQCRYKVYVIDECHMLSTQAFNALLKTLEEPPRHVVFVLATTDPQRVLPTIISRCQRFDFRRIPIDAMVQHLRHIAVKENINITTEAITLVAQVSQGGLRDAESLLDQLGLLSGEITPEKVWDLVGSVSEYDLLDLLKAIVSDNSEAVIDCNRKILDCGKEPLIILQNLASFYRDLLIVKTAPSRNDLVACTQAMWGILTDVAQNLEISTILQGQQHLRTSEVQIKNTTQPRLWLEITLLGLLPSAIGVPIAIQPPAIGYQENRSKFNSSPHNSSPPKANIHPQGAVDHPPTPHSVVPSHPPASNNIATPKASENGNGTRKQYTTPQPESSTPSTASVVNNSSPASPPPNPSPPPEIPAQINVNQIWQQVLANFLPVSRRELLRQMCRIVEFDGSMARVAVKEAWYKKVQQDQEKITTAFQVTFNRQIQVNLEIANAATPTNSTAATSTPVHSEPDASATYIPPQAPLQPPSQAVPPSTPEKTQPSQISTPRTQPSPAANNTAPPEQAIPTPPQPETTSKDPEIDLIMNAARRLAQALDGEIIPLNEEPTEISDELADSSELEELDEDDVEF
ncbi:DNA polymerase III subunit gamma/tau [Plectonema cf. radiosum LEGE 06105]|uniref:DNA polymerase III subunit gamma/tau n=1 Tax=Plectonema cf. radiosum LEGE 06105 TaxID=945769 RepID=A0A8J7K4L1_9CYAN|nr:DNA polymerase III subunit gamma/tau [Plectonema radiosum]MBE9214782.1 DNA polymerase III subunit gamma/tau [Plectonema cf. radiosum LEGE 06105]